MRRSMTTNAPAATVQWRAALWVFLASTLVMLKPLALLVLTPPSTKPDSSDDLR